MTALSTLLLLAALICAFAAAAVGFGQWHAQDAHVLGWLGASFTLFLLSDLLELVDR